MTPLEELQAAHGRLSELRDGSSPAAWEVVRCVDAGDEQLRDIECGGVAYVAEYLPATDADLIVTLHRTIDAQLHLIAESILVHARHWEKPRKYKLHVSDDVMELARAINGEVVTAGAGE